jgi:N-acyl amino acid synthase FeeM
MAPSVPGLGGAPATAAPPRASRRSRPAKRCWVDTTAECLELGVAADRTALDTAFRLVHDQYLWRGFITEPHPTGRRLNLRHALPATRVFLARAADRVVGTASLIPDSPLGLPMEDVFGPEVRALRAEGRRLGEISALAMDADRRAYGLPALVRLLRLVVVYALDVGGLDDVCMAVRPQHAAFYRQLGACRLMGEPRDYPKVHIDGAVGLRLDLHHVRAQMTAFADGEPPLAAIDAFLCSPAARAALGALLERQLPGATLSPADFAYFFDGQDVLGQATPADRAYVESFYGRGSS